MNTKGLPRCPQGHLRIFLKVDMSRSHQERLKVLIHTALGFTRNENKKMNFPSDSVLRSGVCLVENQEESGAHSRSECPAVP